MAIYHLSVKPISRSAGRSSTAAAAYRAGCKIADERTGEIFDFTRKRGVESADVVLPDLAPQWFADRVALWNAAERAEKRKDACVAREIEIALPAELSADERRRLAVDFGKWMANTEGCGVDVAIHLPNREGDQRNHHAHIMRTTRKIGPDGLTEKLDSEKSGRDRRADLEKLRTRWAELCNERLLENGIHIRIDHRTLQDQGIDREPTIHFGPAVIGMERRSVSSHVQHRINEEVEQRLRAAREQAKRDQEAEKTRQSIIDLSSDIAAAKAEQKLQAKIDAWEAKAEAKLAERERAFELDRQRAEQERQQQEAKHRAEVLEKVAVQRPAFEKMKQEVWQRAELERQQKMRRQLEQQRRRDRGRDRGYDGPGLG